jgi:DNA-binding LacI/PurR family transcriptional regulator
MPKKITIRDVAEKAGVSYQTVSRVLNEKQDVAPETRERVLSVIDALNYRPSLAARTLNQERTMIIGVTIPFEPDFVSEQSHLLQILCGANRAAVLRDYSTLLSTLRSQDDTLSAYTHLLKEHLVDGVLVEGAGGEDGAQLLVEKGYPVVIVGYSNDLYCVHSDDKGGAYLMTQHLIALGHRRIGVINGGHERAANARLNGYKNALQDSGLPFEANLIVDSDYSSQGGYKAAATLMEHRDPPTAIFALNDLMAMGAMHWLQEHHLRVPEDISVGGFDDIASAAYYCPPLTTVRQFSYDLGQRAVSLLFDLIDKNAPTLKEIVLPSHLMVRSTTAPIQR